MLFSNRSEVLMGIGMLVAAIAGCCFFFWLDSHGTKWYLSFAGAILAWVLTFVAYIFTMTKLKF